MASLAELFSQPPFLTGVRQREREIEAREAQELQRKVTLQQLLGAQTAQQEAQRKHGIDAQLRSTLQQTGGDIPKAIQALIAQGPEGIKLAGVLAEATKDLRDPQRRQTIVPPGSTVLGPENQPVFTAPPKYEPKTRTIQMGEETVTQELTTEGTWREIGRGPKFAKSVGTTIVNPAPVTPVKMKNPASSTGWSEVDGRSGRIIVKDAAPPAQSTEAADLAGRRTTAREEAEREARRPQATAARNTMVENLDNLKTNLTELKAHKGLDGITGAVFGRTPSIRKESMAAQAIYDNIVNNVFVNALQSMRAASKTGGAVGNVSDKEGDRLEQTLAALSRAQQEPDFKAQIEKAIARLELAKKNIEDAYLSEYGRRSTDKSGADEPPPGAVRPR